MKERMTMENKLKFNQIDSAEQDFKKITFSQPKMRFKARNDSERIIDQMNMNSMYAGDKQVLASKQADMNDKKMQKKLQTKKSLRTLRREECFIYSEKRK